MGNKPMDSILIFTKNNVEDVYNYVSKIIEVKGEPTRQAERIRIDTNIGSMEIIPFTGFRRGLRNSIVLYDGDFTQQEFFDIQYCSHELSKFDMISEKFFETIYRGLTAPIGMLKSIVSKDFKYKVIGEDGVIELTTVDIRKAIDYIFSKGFFRMSKERNISEKCYPKKQIYCYENDSEILLWVAEYNNNYKKFVEQIAYELDSL